MYYIDSKRTVTRRESSLVFDKEKEVDLEDNLSNITIRTLKDHNDVSESSLVFIRPKGAIRKELVTQMFESMLGCIVTSWRVLSYPNTKPEGYQTPDEKSINENTVKKRKSTEKAGKLLSAKTRRSRSKIEVSGGDNIIQDPMQRVWWSGPDERVVIQFTNGNIFEGAISMKCMNGEGRFQWADGTIYFGNFKDNCITGNGKICWKDDSWYEGDFVGNIRHGHGLFVDSRSQRSYSGGWYNGTKHGHGVMFYAEASHQNSYEGDWEQNARHGYGLREYCKMSGYQGGFQHSTREGKGLMIWPNHDVYRGGWKNGLMSGKGIYIWDIIYNYTLTMPCQITYIGDWLKGERHGDGVLEVGVGYGALYKGKFENNKKHGEGKFVTSNGFIFRNKHLFVDDNFGSLIDEISNESVDLSNIEDSMKTLQYREYNPHQFNICDDTVGLGYHVDKVFKNIDRNDEIKTSILNEYFLYNKLVEPVQKQRALHKRESVKSSKLDCVVEFDIADFYESEKRFLYQAIRCFDRILKDIYQKYATICNTKDIYFRPVLIRLYLWQLFFDCSIHQKGLTFVEIDKLLLENPDWQIQTTHCPFQKILYWQFIHCLVCVALKLYAKTDLPGPKPDNICGLAFRRLMECDIIPGTTAHKGHLVNGHALYIPLKGLYTLYKSIGEPHTVRQFIMAIRKPTQDFDELQPRMKHIPYDVVTKMKGYNGFVKGDELRYIVEEEVFQPAFVEARPQPEAIKLNNPKLKLFNFANMPIKMLISYFTDIFPQIMSYGKLMDLEIEITFFEFFEVFITCVEESNRIAEYTETVGESISDSLLEN